jgi:hypothetical protein
MKSVYCGERINSLNKLACAWFIMKSVYCEVRTVPLNKVVCIWFMMKSFTARYGMGLYLEWSALGYDKVFTARYRAYI